MEVHQVLVGAALGDAITGEAVALQRELRKSMRSEIFAHHRDSDLCDRVHSIEEFEAVTEGSGDDAVLLLHVSIAEGAVLDFVMRRRERVVIRYHNITPAEYFDLYDPAFASLLRRGREDLALLRERAAGAIAVSQFNARDLVEAGFTRTAVVPLVTSVGDLLAAPSLRPARADIPVTDDAPVLLFVGRVAPNKGHAACMQVLHVVQTYHRPSARMLFVGGGEVAGYRRMLDRAADELALRCAFTGKVHTEQLAALYRRADVFLSMSEHEGFGAPLVEAMALGVPVIALAAAAVPETLAGAGILLPRPDPVLAAAAVRRVLEDAALREQLVAAGRARAAELAPEGVAPRLVDALLAAAV